MKNKYQYLYSLILVLLLFITTYLGNKNIFYLFIGINILFISKPLILSPSYFISSLSGTFFSMEEGSSISRYLSLILIVSLVYNQVKSKSFLNNKTVHVGLIIILLFYNFLSSTFSLTGSFNSFFLMAQNLLILLLFSNLYNKDSYDIYLSLHHAAIIIICCLIFQFQANEINFLLVESRISINEDVNENRLAMMLAQLAVISIYPIFTDSKLENKLISISFYFISLFLIILTGSRSALLASTLSVIIIFIFFFKKLSLKTYLYIVLIISFFIVFTITLINLDLPVLNRFNINNLVESKGSDRLPTIITLVENIIPNNLLFGVGLGGDNIIKAIQPYGLTHPGHNIIIDTLSQIGLIGFISYFSLIFIIVKKTIKNRTIDKNSYLPLVMIITALINGTGENMFPEKILWNSLSIGAFLVYNNYLINNQIFKLKDE